MLVTEAFKQFTKERHAEDKILTKGKNFNLLQEVYASTEFFDLTLYDNSKEKSSFKASDIKKDESYLIRCFMADTDICLPFVNNFIKIEDLDSYIFIREYEPNVLTGSMFSTNKKLMDNIPFIVRLYDNHQFVISVDSICFKQLNFIYNFEVLQEVVDNFFLSVASTLIIVNSLNKKQVVTDNYNKDKNYADYYRLKGKGAIKVPSRPIYYVLGDKVGELSKVNQIKSRGYTEYSHAFKVRGHYRKLKPNKKGHDRNGKEVLGYTWVHEYVKGEGELVKRIRIIK